MERWSKNSSKNHFSQMSDFVNDQTIRIAIIDDNNILIPIIFILNIFVRREYLYQRRVSCMVREDLQYFARRSSPRLQ